MKFINFSYIFFIIILLSFGTICAQSPIESIELNNDENMPVFGIDLTSLTPVQAEIMSFQAIEKGYRLLHFGGSSGLLEAAGRGIRRAIEEGLVSRADLFLSVSVLPFEADENTDINQAAENAVLRTVEPAGLDYIDLMILSQNRFDLDFALYRAMENAVQNGLIHSLGLSGFAEIRNLELFTGQITIPPAVLMIETHPYRQNISLKVTLEKTGTRLAAVNPLGSADDRSVLFADSTISPLATWYRKTSNQIILRWQLQSGNILLPTAVDESQLDEYLEILNFELTENDIEEINTLDRSDLHQWY